MGTIIPQLTLRQQATERRTRNTSSLTLSHSSNRSLASDPACALLLSFHSKPSNQLLPNHTGRLLPNQPAMPSSAPRRRSAKLIATSLSLIILGTLQQQQQHVQAFVVGSSSSTGSITPGPSRWQRQAPRIVLFSAPPNGFYGSSFQRKSMVFGKEQSDPPPPGLPVVPVCFPAGFDWLSFTAAFWGHCCCFDMSVCCVLLPNKRKEKEGRRGFPERSCIFHLPPTSTLQLI